MEVRQHQNITEVLQSTTVLNFLGKKSLLPKQSTLAGMHVKKLS